MHGPVLLQEALDGLALKEGDTVIDATVGGGGHAETMCAWIGHGGFLVGLDRDRDAIGRVRKRLGHAPCRVELREADFRNLDAVLDDLGVSEIDAALFDLGLNSEQLEASGRGFSFQKNEPLLMTYGVDSTKEDLTAREIVNTWEEENIAAVLKGYGEEKFARAIARKIVELRAERPFETTGDLVTAIEKSVPQWYRHKKIHCATKTFQALRIAVNDEIEGLREGLSKAFERIGRGGRIAVIAFHGTEDRVVKHFFRQLAQDGAGTVITKKPLVPTGAERTQNPRARSAKLRIFEKSI